jgi:NAD(P)-dependent dehydrogenase (short-subunit alcohol dehydrogenase family)
LRLKDRVVVVTGAAGTIGRVSAGPLGTLMEELDGTAGTIWGRAADASDFDEFSRLLADATDVLGRPDVLVNVAGTFKFADFVDSSPADWAEMISTNLLTALVASRAVLPAMLEVGSGTIVNFASTAGEYGSIRPAAAYAAAKAGVIGFTKSLAREVSPLGVRVNAISPGPIDTPALKAVTEAERAKASSRTLLGRLGQPHDIAQGVLYLASDESAFVTGTVLQVNGGSLL